jgi:hypothetical protein
MSHGLRGMAVGRLRLSFGLKHQRYPSVLTGFKVKTKAIRHRLDFINLNAHVDIENIPLIEVRIA